MSSLGDLLLGKAECKERPQSPIERELKEQNDVIDEKIQDGHSTSHHPIESPINVQKVFPERTVVEKDTDDCRSNASSTDDYVRELLDPNDRPRNVWHVVEGPQERQGADASDQNTTRAHSSQSSSNNDAHDNNRTNGDLETPRDDDADDEKNDEALNNIPSDEQQQQQQNSRDRTEDDDYRPSSPPPDSVAGGGGNIDRRERGHSREKSSSSHRRSHRDRHSDRDRSRDDRDKHRHNRDSGGDKEHRSGEKSRSRRRYDYSDDDYDDDIDLRDHESYKRGSRHRRRSSRSRSRSISKSSSRRRDRSRSGGSQSPVTRRNSRTILVMQLSPRVRSRDLEVFFKELGRVREVRLIMDSQTRRHKGIAYIEFEDAKTATKALASNGQKLCGVPMVIQSALLDNKNHNMKGSDWHSSSSTYKNNNNSHHTSSHSSSRSNLPPNSYRVYVGSLHVALTEEMLRSVFEPFGPIIKVELMKDRATGISRGYAFLTYANTEDGMEAVRCLDGFELAGKNLRVSKSADKSGEH